MLTRRLRNCEDGTPGIVPEGDFHPNLCISVSIGKLVGLAEVRIVRFQSAADLHILITLLEHLLQEKVFSGVLWRPQGYEPETIE
jgi:hypothetical protein